MNIFFDVDDTLISWDMRLRPGVHEIFGQLRSEGHVIYLWSGNGKRWPVVERFKLHEHIEDCFSKPLYNYRERLDEHEVPLVPDFVIDDHVEVTEAFPGVQIEPPATPIGSDREMWRVYDAIQDFVAVRAEGMAAG